MQATTEGVLVAGDRLASEGLTCVAARGVQKVYPADAHSLIAIAGAAGPGGGSWRGCIRIELEHYEKIEGEPLELEGKANKLSQMVRANLPAAMQGLVVVPLFAGYDLRRKHGAPLALRRDRRSLRRSGVRHLGKRAGIFAKESLKKVLAPGPSPAKTEAVSNRAPGADRCGRRGSRQPVRIDTWRAASSRR